MMAERILMYSQDGLEWKAFPGNSLVGGNNIKYINDYIIAVGAGGKIVYTQIPEQ
jgi:hypothetical protein